MIHLAPIRAELDACTSDRIEISKEQLQQLLDEAELGQAARRTLRLRGAGIKRVPTAER